VELSDYITVTFSTLTLLVTVIGWYFTHKAQDDLAKSQREYDRRKEVRQNLAPARARQLDSIENWLAQVMPQAAELLQSPDNLEVLDKSRLWQTQTHSLIEIARQHDPLFRSLSATDKWVSNNPTPPSDLPQLISAIGRTNLDYLRALRSGDQVVAYDLYMKLTRYHGHGHDALERVRRHLAAISE
jgi:hypothetical protein